MKIGIDIDGVLTDTINFTARELSKALKRDISAYEVAHELGKVEGIDEIFEQEGERFLCSLDPYENAVDVINAMNKKHEVYIISARFHVHYDITIEWLKRNGIEAKEVIFTQGKSKVNVCKMHGIELFVEDSVKNASELAEEGIKIIVYSAEYNTELSGENIYRCHDWIGVQNTIDKLDLI